MSDDSFCPNCGYERCSRCGVCSMCGYGTELAAGETIVVAKPKKPRKKKSKVFDGGDTPNDDPFDPQP